MSYILDALKKSEAERNRGSLPTLLTVPGAGLLRSSGAVWALLVVLIINAGLLVVWLYRPTQTDHQQQSVSSVPAPEPARTVVAAAPAPRERIVLPESPAPAIPAPITAIQTGPGTAGIAPATNPEPPTRQFAFSTHVYADDPTLRAVTLDGRRFLEGDTISAGVRLKEITETGVVLDIDGRDVAMDVLQDWR